jgi:hypothetical protein
MPSFSNKSWVERRPRQQRPTSATENKSDRKSEDGGGEDDDDNDEDDDEIMDSEDEDEQETIHEIRQAKLSQLREEVEEAKRDAVPLAQKEGDALREQHLTTAHADVDDAPLIKRKKKEEDVDVTGAAPHASSLISNLLGVVPPPHEFSARHELTAARGTILLPIDSAVSFKWTPPEGVDSPNEGAFQVDLSDFDVSCAQIGQGNNTVAEKVTCFPFVLLSLDFAALLSWYLLWVTNS